MKKYACRYAIVKFLPYPETGEFANIGIVLACPALGYMDFLLLDKGHRRITTFFEELDARVYKQAVMGFGEELRRIRADIQSGWSLNAEPELLRQIFDQLVHPREAIVRFDAARVVMAEEPKVVLHELFSHYVHREFTKNQVYQERLLVVETRNVLRSLKLVQPFRPDTLGDDDYHAKFDFVQRVDGDPVKVIKPFYLAQEDTNKIYQHADIWLQRVRRLRNRKQLPAQVLFAVQAPDENDASRFQAFADIRDELQAMDVLVATADAHQLTQFAAGNQIH
ncbi:MAG TPA: DUF3037 domain-containing protein [Pseudomonadales bacterium]|nr:DUF3037 domain-containing protein [Pseudomonadales bacterium]HRG51028.1 DUF3037 domain-containing protein [Pseudomonadales bacterium]